MALQAHQVEPANELALIGVHGKPGTEQLLAIFERPTDDALGGPRYVAILEERHQIIGDGAAHRILEIENSRIGGLAHQKVPRMIIPMHERRRLRRGRLHQNLEQTIEHGARRRVHPHSEVAAQEPFGHQLHFTQQQGAIVGRQRTRGRGACGLYPEQRGQRIGVEAVDFTLRRQLIQVLPRAQIRQQQQALTHVLRQDQRHVQSDRRQRARDPDEGRELLFVGGGIHHDIRVAAAGEAEIAAKTRIARRRLDPAAGESQVVHDPARQQLEAGIACIRYTHA